MVATREKTGVPDRRVARVREGYRCGPRMSCSPTLVNRTYGAYVCGGNFQGRFATSASAFATTSYRPENAQIFKRPYPTLTALGAVIEAMNIAFSEYTLWSVSQKAVHH
jgi:hypothetical protein